MKNRQIDRCIYCGSVENLSDEHIVPLALGGTHILLKASCGDCAKVTAEVERCVLNVCWKGFRWVTGMPTRHKKRQPLTMPAGVRRGDEWIESELPLGKYTGVAGFPVFREPGVFHEGQGDELRWESIGAVVGSAGGEDAYRSPATRAGVSNYRVPVWFEPEAIARMLAKIGHGYAVDFFGLDAFEAFLPPVILGQTNDIGRWVGTPRGIVFPEPADHGHRVRIDTLKDTPIIIAGIQLFADGGAPEYIVVVGKLHGREVGAS